MTQNQEQHLEDIKRSFCEEVDAKYRAGQKEHGGNLWDRDVVPDINNEAIDLVTYAYTNRERQNKIRRIIYEWNSGAIKPEDALAQFKTMFGFQ